MKTAYKPPPKIRLPSGKILLKWGIKRTDRTSETLAVTQLPFSHLVEIYAQTKQQI